MRDRAWRREQAEKKRAREEDMERWHSIGKEICRNRKCEYCKKGRLAKWTSNLVGRVPDF